MSFKQDNTTDHIPIILKGYNSYTKQVCNSDILDLNVGGTWSESQLRYQLCWQSFIFFLYLYVNNNSAFTEV
jgi:hypothetical protein